MKLIHCCNKKYYNLICFLPVGKVTNMYNMTNWHLLLWALFCVWCYLRNGMLWCIEGLCCKNAYARGGKIKVAWVTLILEFPDFWMLFCATFSLPQTGVCTVFYLHTHGINKNKCFVMLVVDFSWLFVLDFMQELSFEFVFEHFKQLIYKVKCYGICLSCTEVSSFQLNLAM